MKRIHFSVFNPSQPGSWQRRFRLTMLAMAAVLFGMPLLLLRPAIANPPQLSRPGWTLVWSDEFEGHDGSAPDPRKWTYDLGGSGWGNDELQTYTLRSQNISIQNGKLIIAAFHENYTGPDGLAKDFTSARVKTQGLFAQEYGRFEARIKIPYGQGIWPAFWILGDNFAKDGWPACGEIDIMENIGKEPAVIHGSLQGPGYSGANHLSAAFHLPGGRQFSDGFHIFAVEWEPNAVQFYVDSYLYSSFTSADVPGGKPWVFNHKFFILLNVAVGGNWPGPPDSTTVFPQVMQVDYVRVYKLTSEIKRK
ncbi:MAG: glycoside hydrolase family 16 protein [Candidatus Acidiferrales bacterium]